VTCYCCEGYVCAEHEVRMTEALARALDGDRERERIRKRDIARSVAEAVLAVA